MSISDVDCEKYMSRSDWSNIKFVAKKITLHKISQKQFSYYNSKLSI